MFTGFDTIITKNSPLIPNFHYSNEKQWNLKVV